MAAIGNVQIAGNANAGPIEVELNTLAARAVSRPQDWTIYGSYRIGTDRFTVCSASAPSSLATITATPTNRIVFNFFNPSEGMLAAVRYISFGCLQSAGTAQHQFKLFRATNYNSPLQCLIDVGPTGGSSGSANPTPFQYTLLPSNFLVPAKMRVLAKDSEIISQIPATATAFSPLGWEGGNNTGGTFATTLTGNTFLVDNTTFGTLTQAVSTNFANQPAGGTTLALSGTAIAAAGLQYSNASKSNRVLDAQPIAVATFGLNGAAGISSYPLFDQRAGEHPLILSADTGIELQWTTTQVYSTALFDITMTVEWDELAPTW